MDFHGIQSPPHRTSTKSPGNQSTRQNLTAKIDESVKHAITSFGWGVGCVSLDDSRNAPLFRFRSAPGR